MPVLVTADFYTLDSCINEMPMEKYLKLREDYPEFNLPETKPSYAWADGKVFTLDRLEELISEYGLIPSISRIRGLKYDKPSYEGLSNQDIQQAERTVNVTQVSVANNALLAIQNVTWLEDACTQELQSMLDLGWRILAVCPPNDTRRPTYILGHTEKDMSNG